jgi:hypothetical protein
MTDDRRVILSSVYSNDRHPNRDSVFERQALVQHAGNACCEADALQRNPERLRRPDEQSIARRLQVAPNLLLGVSIGLLLQVAKAVLT